MQVRTPERGAGMELPVGGEEARTAAAAGGGGGGGVLLASSPSPLTSLCRDGGGQWLPASSVGARGGVKLPT